MEKRANKGCNNSFDNSEWQALKKDNRTPDHGYICDLSERTAHNIFKIEFNNMTLWNPIAW